VLDVKPLRSLIYTMAPSTRSAAARAAEEASWAARSGPVVRYIDPARVKPPHTTS